ncbi:OmpA family protein [Psychromarinibacter sp. C21-152]|uniref:OmpA family protein n=1 Tax=Psychromarinibacter sediminicola TaxID=3033385 RepID=A0AAE3T8F3_9RHOB|nr:OmpA family protein [Psychromarinibacter sediminicola]MDF0600638.1 OmpA family protein [Psychromarinibacter sediminicola]
MSWAVAISALALGAAAPAWAETLRFPAAAEQTAHRVVADDSHFLPTGPHVDGSIDGLVAEGRVETTAWVVGDGDLTTMQLMGPLRDQLIDAGFRPVFECETQGCGGFDFRYEIDVLPEPDMHVNLGDFRYFAGKRGDGAEFVSLVVSRSSNTGFVQITRIGAPEVTTAFTASTKTPAPDAPVVPAPDGPVAALLESEGHATLDDLAFRSGASELGGGNFESLKSLADYLKANPDRRVMLVGHTDAEGPLSANVDLSRRRAAAVMERLIQQYDIPPDQVASDGVGFLAPRASNLTPEGRTENRRVEVILTSTQ